MFTCHHHRLFNGKNAFLHAVVRLDIENGGSLRRDAGFELLGRALVGVTRLDYFAASQRDHGVDRRAEVDVMATRQHDFPRYGNRRRVQIHQQVGVVFDDQCRYRLGDTCRGAGNDHRIFDIQQIGDIGTGLVDQILDFKIVIQAVVNRVNDVLTRCGHAKHGHAT
ncbi:hypothetical protein D3C78_1392210 [compost metagenome]